ncbi:diguanylate cyclase domain-containing protein [Actimicrobium sp. CCI2.3]|uniref:diguanylate cyclase domain-containing protein n=1 Tax=Actimicrobium sp. CCI2.3 TaxID=3048616 RepID=UPI002AB3BDB5|nr:diguanylate cyclase [Actimicrobium sp. CCI2.3]MDY7574970.1 diguanylate cyclase [Actimicrobium sp. CCI2.3]MEB0021459.1 diguanylate cyclase [Actimicrobium sp. CCI2.3]
MLSEEDIHSAKILIVDDSQDNVRLMLAVLEQDGYVNVSDTTKPQDVAELHRLNKFDLILLDIQMPMMDGFKVMKALQDLAQDAWLPVLAITAHPDHRISALEAGAMDFMVKPFHLDEILHRIHNMLEVRLLFNKATRNGDAMYQLALHDPLTGLPNRRLLDDRISIALAHARRDRTLVALMYMDLDGFKQINDTMGHGHGDELLQLVSQRLVATARSEDTVARIGGDEFVLVMGNLTNLQDVHATAQKMINAVGNPYTICDAEVNITASIGISLSGTAPAEGLIQLADAALYEAKRNGKNRYHVDAPPCATDAFQQRNLQ